ncbi:hypothetical protein EWM64_g3736 [Hericium alpestre]|uniref:Uncharacterized protein n=1 Tax=Hericium alpestre TaxID=135208 RepID=A0A4Z0A1D3_9AGAM|nr:hypothetical protein EWM64_g3736 [Hericium alpestre]
MLGPFSLRSAFRTLAVQRSRPVVHSYVVRRQFSVTPQRFAVEPEADFIKNIKHTEFFKKVADKPEVLKALSDLAALVKDMGIDISSKTPPSNKMMFQLATNRKFYTAVRRVTAQLEEAGVDLKAANAIDEIMELSKEISKKDS